MQITLMCHDKYGSVSFRAETIEGLTVLPRRYTIQNYQVTLADYPDEILHHDAEELLKNPLFRMPTPAELDAMAEAERAASSVQEVSPTVSAPKQQTSKVTGG